MNRLIFFNSVFGLTMCVLGNCAKYAHSQQTAISSRPNVLMIVVDDLNDWVGYLARENKNGLLDELVPDPTKRKRLQRFLTPNIDKLAASGVAFLDAHCNCPLCGPSRASFLTGVLPSRSGFYGNDHQSFRKFVNDGKRWTTLPQHFKEQGYLTIEAGKVFHLGRGGNAKQKSPVGSDPQSWSAQHVSYVGTAWRFQPKMVGGIRYCGNRWTFPTPNSGLGPTFGIPTSGPAIESDDWGLGEPKQVDYARRWHKGMVTGSYFPDFFCWGVLPTEGDHSYAPVDWGTYESTFDYRHADFVAQFLADEDNENDNRFQTDVDPESGNVIQGLPLRRSEQPFFIVYGGHRPHDPFIVPASFRDALEQIIAPEDLDLAAIDGDNQQTRLGRIANSLAGLGNLHTAITTCGEEDFEDRYHYWREALYMYLASVHFADACIGRVMEGYEKCPEKENTVIVMLSDHGWHLGSKDHWSKMTLWQESTHIPMIIRAPGFGPATCKRTVSLISIFPTLVELAGIQRPHESSDSFQRWDGQSLVPLLEDPQGAWDEPVVASYRSTGYDECITSIDERWRLIHYKSTGEEELYDRLNDPLELRNLVHPTASRQVKGEAQKAYFRLKNRMAGVLSGAATGVRPLYPDSAAYFQTPSTDDTKFEQQEAN